MADFSFSSTRLPSERPQGFSPYLNVEAPAAAFGAPQGQALQVAGANLQRASENFDSIAMREQAIANETRVEGDVNTFIEQKQKALTDFVQLRGEAAIKAAPDATKALLDLKKSLADGAANPQQRLMLNRRLDSQFFEATGTINAHVANQSTAWQKDTLNARSALLDKQGVMDRDNPGQIAGQLAAKATIGVERARIEHGAPPDSDIAKVLVQEEQSKYLKGVLQSKIDDGNKRAALALYEKYGEVLKRDAGVSAAMKGVRTEIDGENAANEALAKAGLPQIRSGETGDLMQKRQEMTGRLQQAGFSSIAAAGIAANFEHESGFRSSAVNPRDGSDGSDSIGLGQWNGPRAKALTQFAKSKGLDPNSADAQIGYMQAELSGDVPFSTSGISPDLKGRLEKAKTPEEAASLLSREYFKPRAATEAADRGRTAASIPTATFKGDLKAGYQQAAADIQNRTDLSPEVRANALATLNKTAANVTAYRDASVKSLRDEVNATLAVAFSAPDKLKPGTFAAFADKAQALGESELATRYRYLAAMEGTIRNGLAGAPADQVKMLRSIAEGLPKQLLEGLGGSDADALAKAGDAFEKLKKAQTEGLDPAGLKDMATNAAKLYADAGKGEKAQEVARFYSNMVSSSEALKLDPVKQQQLAGEVEEIARTGQMTEGNVELYAMLRQGIQTQQTAFARDPYAAGQSLYGMPQLPLDDGPGRARQAAEIAAKRGGITVPPMSETEFGQLRTQLQNGTPDAAAKTLQSIALNYPPDTFRAIGAGLAGKSENSDPVSRGYAAAFAMFAERDPARAMLAREVLDGVQRRKEMGDSARKLVASSDAVQQAVQDKLGNAFIDARGVPAIIVDAAEAIYTSRMMRAGRSGEKLDSDMLNSALGAVVGQTVTRNGQMFLPPKGVSSYQIDTALRSMVPADVAGLRTLNGSEVTAEKIARYGLLTNATGPDGGEGRFWVKIPDPAQGFAPAYVQAPDGKPWVLDIRPLLERKPVIPTEESEQRARRNAPASPTSNVDPLAQ